MTDTAHMNRLFHDQHHIYNVTKGVAWHIIPTVRYTILMCSARQPCFIPGRGDEGTVVLSYPVMSLRRKPQGDVH
jgi:hypothetical protein